MRRANIAVLVGAAACLLVAATFAARTAIGPRAARADDLGIPFALSAGADDDLYVSIVGDCGCNDLLRLDSTGAALARRTIADDYCLTWHHYDVASSPDGVYVALWDADAVRHYTQGGEISSEWPADGLENHIATGRDRSDSETEVYVITSVAGAGREVRRYGPRGDLRSAFPVAASAHELAVMSSASPYGATVFVAERLGPTGEHDYISLYDASGEKIDQWRSDVVIEGLDGDPSGYLLWAGVGDPSSGARRVQAFGRDGEPAAHCELPAFPTDLSVDRSGDLYVLVDWADDQFYHREVHRYRQDCTLVSAWDMRALEQWPRRPTVPATIATPTSAGAAQPVTVVRLPVALRLR